MFLNGITIVLCGHRESLAGAAIAWATKIEKNHVLVSLPAGSAIAESIESRNLFSVNVLGAHQSEIVRQYGGRKQSRPRGRNPDELDFDSWPVPVVKNARANLICTLDRKIPIEQQLVIIATIDTTRFDESIQPLIYDHARYFD